MVNNDGTLSDEDEPSTGNPLFKNNKQKDQFPHFTRIRLGKDGQQAFLQYIIVI